MAEVRALLAPNPALSRIGKQHDIKRANFATRLTDMRADSYDFSMLRGPGHESGIKSEFDMRGSESMGTAGAAPGAGRRVTGGASRRRSAMNSAACSLSAVVLVSLFVEAPTSGLANAVMAVVVAHLVLRPLEAFAGQLPLMRNVMRLVGPMLAAVLVLIGSTLAAEPVPVATVAALLIVGLAALSGELRRGHRAMLPRRDVQRILVLGSERTARDLTDELSLQGVRECLIVGRVSVAPGAHAGSVAVLGSLAELSRLVSEHDVDLLVVGPDLRMAAFDEISRSCLHLPVRTVDVGEFCERTFGHVPVAEINAAWFQSLMHPTFRHRPSAAKRALDVSIAGTVGLLFLPVLAVLWPLIRRDGGPLFYLQTRVGEGGVPFTILKLRTMTVHHGPDVWTSQEDARITRTGALLRRTHLDEIPQVLNVLRGEMSIVGPRPEQPAYVARLELSIPFYSRRHLIRPGITGWAQVRCGYAGSVEGSAWKVCHDLFYVKHRSLGLDLVILAETVRTFFADRQFAPSPVALSPFAVVTQAAPEDAEPPPSTPTSSLIPSAV